MAKLKKLTAADARERLAGLPGWVVNRKGELEREFKFADFPRAFGFMAAVATVAQSLDHHPDWGNVYNRVSVRLSTHDAGGLTAKDFELARRMGELA